MEGVLGFLSAAGVAGWIHWALSYIGKRRSASPSIVIGDKIDLIRSAESTISSIDNVIHLAEHRLVGSNDRLKEKDRFSRLAEFVKKRKENLGSPAGRKEFMEFERLLLPLYHVTRHDLVEFVKCMKTGHFYSHVRQNG